MPKLYASLTPHLLPSHSSSTALQTVPMVQFLLLFTLFLSVAVARDDTTVMLRLREGLTPKPSSWSATDQYCSWVGVQCDSGKRVVSINLASKALSGSLPPSMSSLTQLRSLFLQGNNFSGAVPSLAHLSLLQQVSLDHNQFTSVPSGCFRGLPRLVSLSMSGSGRLKSWVFPSELLPAENQLSGLQYFGAVRTNMHGTLPEFIGSFPLLKHLMLSHNNLIGPIPETFSGCVSLRDLKLENNYLAGSIPKSLAGLAYLRDFDVSYNNLSGEVPRFAAQVRVNVDGNPRVVKTAPPPPPPPQAQPSPQLHPYIDDSSPLATLSILGLMLGCVLLMAATFVAVHWGIKIKLENANRIRFGDGGAIRFSLDVLTKATDNFNSDNLLGTGGTAKVFKGRLDDGRMLAVKKMHKSKDGTSAAARALKAFKSEIVVLDTTKHINVVGLLGYYEDEEQLMLVYEYMCEGTLADHLFKSGDRLLDWGRRLRIALDVARGVEHIHKFAVHNVVHRDLKPTNILLGDDFTAKVADFGFVHIVRSRDPSKPFSSEAVGTFGYWAPECMYGNLTTKADVYSFGVILMELITGKAVTGKHWSPTDINLVNWLRTSLIKHGGGLDDAITEMLAMVVQPEIHSTEDEIVSSLHAVTKLAFGCTESEPEKRPDMTHVVTELSKLVHEPWQQSDLVKDNTPDLKQHLPDTIQKWVKEDAQKREEEDARRKMKGDPSCSYVHSSGQLGDDAAAAVPREEDAQEQEEEEDARRKMKGDPSCSYVHSSGQLGDDAAAAVPSNSGEHSSRQLEKDEIQVDHA